MMRLFVWPIITLAIGWIAGTNYPEMGSNKSLSYPEHLTGTFTGGFGEETCRSCHFDYDLNPDGGKLTVSEIPQNLSAGETVEIQIAVEREDLGTAGFQLSARYADGSQAGQFMIEEHDRVMFTKTAADSLQYVQHTSEGTKSSEENKTSWKVNWQAPESPEGNVIFNITANAANGDMSEFGDFIYAEELKVEF